MQHTTLQIAGMSCGHCVMSVKKALATLDGVTVENVAVGSATISYDPALASIDQIAGAVTDAGYDVRPTAPHAER